MVVNYHGQKFYNITSWSELKQHFFKLSLIVEGATEKVLQMPLKKTHNKNFSFNKLKCIVE
jgi:hypothetical protein